MMRLRLSISILLVCVSLAQALEISVDGLFSSRQGRTYLRIFLLEVEQGNATFDADGRGQRIDFGPSCQSHCAVGQC